MILLRVWPTARTWRELAYVLVGRGARRCRRSCWPLLGGSRPARCRSSSSGCPCWPACCSPARRTPRYFRGPARRLLGWDWPDPPPLGRRTRLGAVWRVLGDATAWRALAYCFLQLPAGRTRAPTASVVAVVSGLVWPDLPGLVVRRPDRVRPAGRAHLGADLAGGGPGRAAAAGAPVVRPRLIVLRRPLAGPRPARARAGPPGGSPSSKPAGRRCRPTRPRRCAGSNATCTTAPRPGWSSLGVALSRIEHRSTEPPVRDAGRGRPGHGHRGAGRAARHRPRPAPAGAGRRPRRGAVHPGRPQRRAGSVTVDLAGTATGRDRRRRCTSPWPNC